MTYILATFQTIIQQREKHANLPVPSPPNSPPFDFDGRNFLRSSSALTFSQRWKNANKAKGNFIEVKLLPPSVHPSASWRIAKKPIGQLHCRGSCLSIFISLPESLRWGKLQPPAAKWGLTRSVLYGKERARVLCSRWSTNPSSFNICLELLKNTPQLYT